MRKCIVKSNSYTDSYLCGSASYSSDLFSAKIFDQKDLPKHILNGSDEIIFLDSEKGLELLVEEIELLDLHIPQEEAKLEEMKKGREKLYNANPEMISKYIKRYNQLNNGVIEVSSKRKEKIIEELVGEEK